MRRENATQQKTGEGKRYRKSEERQETVMVRKIKQNKKVKLGRIGGLSPLHSLMMNRANN